MKLRWIPSTALVVCLAFHPVETSIVFAPSDGSQVTKSFEVALSFALEDFVMTMNGQESPFGMDGMRDEAEGDVGYTLEVVDLFETVAAGQPTKLSRKYESFSMHYDVGDNSGEEGFEEVEGKTVRFVWNAEDEDYERSWGEDSEDEADEAVLNVLAVDLDMRALLPRGPVSEGDRWQVEVSRLGSLFVPGLDLSRAASADVEGFDQIPADFLGPIQEALDDAIVECTFRGLSGGADGDLAVIGLSLSADVSIDAADKLMEQIEAQGDGEMEPDIGEFTIDLALECSGELLWNPRRGVFSTFELDGEATIDVYLVADVQAGGMGAMEIEGEAELGLEMAISAKAE
jgi:hypothetical protein